MRSQRSPLFHRSSPEMAASASSGRWSRHIQGFRSSSLGPHISSKIKGMEGSFLQPKGKEKKTCEKDFLKTRTFMEFLDLVCGEATAHGVSHAWINRYNALGIFWVIVILSLSIFLGYSLGMHIKKFSSRKVLSQTTTIIDFGGLQLPSVAICNKAYFSRRKLNALNISPDLANYLIGITGTHLVFRKEFITSEAGKTYVEESHKQVMDLLIRHKFTFKQLVDAITYECEELLIMCSIGRTKMNSTECCSAMISVPTLAGKCYVYYSTAQDVQNVEGEFLGVSLYIRNDIDDHPVLNPEIIDTSQMMKTGLQLALISNQTHPFLLVLGQGVNIIPKYYTTIEVALCIVKDVGLKTLYDWDEEECLPADSIGYFPSLDNFFSTEPNCEFGSLRTCFSILCSCSHYALNLGDDSSPPCTPLDLIRCYYMSARSLGKGYSDLAYYVLPDDGFTFSQINASRNCINTERNKCRRACTRFDYTYTTTQLPIRHDVYQGLHRTYDLPNETDLAVMTTFYPNMRYTEISLWRDTISNFISTAGGLTGVFLGCSIVTFVEAIVATVIFFVIFVRYCKTAKYHRHPHTHPDMY